VATCGSELKAVTYQPNMVRLNYTIESEKSSTPTSKRCLLVVVDFARNIHIYVHTSYISCPLKLKVCWVRLGLSNPSIYEVRRPEIGTETSPPSITTPLLPGSAKQCITRRPRLVYSNSIIYSCVMFDNALHAERPCSPTQIPPIVPIPRPTTRSPIPRPEFLKSPNAQERRHL
jgi:hypothetical protein